MKLPERSCIQAGALGNRCDARHLIRRVSSMLHHDADGERKPLPEKMGRPLSAPQSHRQMKPIPPRNRLSPSAVKTRMAPQTYRVDSPM